MSNMKDETVGGRVTEQSNRATSAGEYAKGTGLVRGQSILQNADEGADSSSLIGYRGCIANGELGLVESFSGS